MPEIFRPDENFLLDARVVVMNQRLAAPRPQAHSNSML